MSIRNFINGWRSLIEGRIQIYDGFRQLLKIITEYTVRVSPRKIVRFILGGLGKLFCGKKNVGFSLYATYKTQHDLGTWMINIVSF